MAALDLCWSTDSGEFVGSGRKGRRKGSKNRTFFERIDEKEEKNELKRKNERQRVKNISYQYNRLRIALGDPHPEKKLRKQQVLNSCIDYIQKLQRILQSGSTGPDIDITADNIESDPEISSSTSSFSDHQQSMYHSDLKCKESLTESFTSSPTPPPSLMTEHHPAHLPYPSCQYYQHSNPQHVTSIPPSLQAHLTPSLQTTMNPTATVCQFPLEWNMSEIDLMEEYNFFSCPTTNVFPPPLHHYDLY